MYVLRICAVYLMLLFDKYRYHFKHTLVVFEVSAASTTDGHTDWISRHFRRQGTNVPVGTETPTSVSELRNLGETYNSIFTRINVDATHDSKSTGTSVVSTTQTPSPYRAAIKDGKSSTYEIFGCKKKIVRACKTHREIEHVTLKSSETVVAVTLDSDIPLQGVFEKDEMDFSSAQTTEIALQSLDKYQESNSCCDSDTTTSTRSQDSVAGTTASIRTLRTGAENTRDTTISEPRKKHTLITNIRSMAATKYTTTSVNVKKKKAKKCLSNVAHLMMTITLENITIFYPGISKDTPSHRGNIVFNDPAFKELRTYFLLKHDERIGNAYADSLDNNDEFQSIQCVVDGLTNKIVYTGWHRWEYSTSAGTPELICEASTAHSSSDTDSVTDIPTKYPLWYGSAQGYPGVKYLLGLQPFLTGLYICIAVDASYKVLLTSYLDIRILTVVTSLHASITPQSVQIYTNDTQASFIFNHCRGYVSPQSTNNAVSAQAVHFFNLDDSNVGNVSFTVSYLHRQPWNQAKGKFENLNLNLPMILRCRFTFSSIYKSNVELYFRHESAKNRTHKSFTAITNETLHFSCKDWFAGIPMLANASYFEGNCSEDKPSFANSEGPSMTLTVNKQLCLICSSRSSQVKLQINIEDDYRTTIIGSNGTNEKGDCSIWDIPSELAAVNGSSTCEETAVELLKDASENQSKTITFYPFTYKVYYTSRQFIVCQSQPVAWSTIDQNTKVSTPSDNTYILKVIAALSSIIIALLILLAWMKICTGKQRLPVVRLDSTQPHNCLIQRQSYETADASGELDFANPEELVDQSQISIGPLLGSGKFGRVYKACVKSQRLSNAEGSLDVAVKELKPHADNNTHNIGRVNKEIQIMRMILPHLNIIKYYGFSLGVESNLLIMEIAKGSSLLEYLREQRIRVPGFMLRMNYQSDCPNMNHALVGYTISNSSYSNAAFSHDFFQLRSNSLPPKDDSTHDSMPAVSSDHDVLETADSQHRDSNNFIDCLSMSSVPDQDQWNLEYEDSNTETSVEEHTEQCSSEWLRRNSSAIESMSKEIFSICRQVARGMAHISSLNIIHRDLAARNIVIASSVHPLVVKICDFGMAHNLSEGEVIYKEGSSGPRPFRWMSPEALNKGEFSVFSDIWSYGVVCWEVITLGSYPFGKMPNFAAAAKVAAGHHLPRPSNCEPEIYAIVKSCWKMKPSDRPAFDRLEDKWSDILEANSDYIELRAGELDDCE